MRIKPTLIIKTFKETGSAKKTADILGIHRSTVYRWLKRARVSYRKETYSTRGLKRKSTRPNHIHYALSSSDIVEVLRLRRQRGYGARKVKYLVLSTSSV